jgi:hypothetical protein
VRLQPYGVFRPGQSHALEGLRDLVSSAGDSGGDVGEASPEQCSVKSQPFLVACIQSRHRAS